MLNSTALENRVVFTVKATITFIMDINAENNVLDKGLVKSGTIIVDSTHTNASVCAKSPPQIHAIQKNT